MINIKNGGSSQKERLQKKIAITRYEKIKGLLDHEVVILLEELKKNNEFEKFIKVLNVYESEIKKKESPEYQEALNEFKKLKKTFTPEQISSIENLAKFDPNNFINHIKVFSKQKEIANKEHNRILSEINPENQEEFLRTHAFEMTPKPDGSCNFKFIPIEDVSLNSQFKQFKMNEFLKSNNNDADGENQENTKKKTKKKTKKQKQRQRKKEKYNLEKRKENSIKRIQGLVRGFENRQETRDKLLHNSAEKIQGLVRGLKNRQETRDKLVHNSAEKIQGLVRGFENRKKTKNIKREFFKNEPALAELSNEAIDKIINYQMNLNEKNDILKKTKKKVSELEEKLENSLNRTEELDEMVVNMTTYQQHLLNKIDELVNLTKKIGDKGQQTRKILKKLEINNNLKQYIDDSIKDFEINNSNISKANEIKSRQYKK